MVFEAKSRIDSCVLSPNSAKPTTINGINRSYAVIYVFDSDKLIGLGRALCDGEYQAAISIYDVVLLPEYQVLGEKIWKHYANNEIHVA